MIYPYQLKGYQESNSDPTSSNDINDGRVIGSIWINISSSPRKVFVCTNASNGNAVWERLDNNGSLPAASYYGYLSAEVNKGSLSDQVVVKAGSTAEIDGTTHIITTDQLLFFNLSPTGWWYIVATKNGNSFTTGISKVPGGHITSDTPVYFPIASNTYVASKNGHYISNDRIIAAIYWDGSNVQEVVQYKNGLFNPCFLEWDGGTPATNSSVYFDFSGSYRRIWGNSAIGSNPSSMFKWDINDNGIYTIGADYNIQSGINESIELYLNGVYVATQLQNNTGQSIYVGASRKLILKKNDIVRYYFNRTSGTAQIFRAYINKEI